MFKPKILESGADAATYIGPGAKIVGNLSGEGNFIFCGRIEGECDINGSLTIADGSHWKGAIRATNIILAGSVEGDVTAEQRVEIAGTAHIIGKLCASSVAVAEGAVIEGDVAIAEAKETQTPELDAQPSSRRPVAEPRRDDNSRQSPSTAPELWPSTTGIR